MHEGSAPTQHDLEHVLSIPLFLPEAIHSPARRSTSAIAGARTLPNKLFTGTTYSGQLFSIRITFTFTLTLLHLCNTSLVVHEIATAGQSSIIRMIQGMLIGSKICATAPTTCIKVLTYMYTHTYLLLSD